jgi:hypothetical protein
MAVTSKPPAQEKKERTWPSLLLGPLIWFLHLNTFYAVASVTCKWGWQSFRIAGLPALQLVEVIISLAALLLLARLIIVPWRNWRRFQAEKPPENPRMLHDTEKDRRPLVAFVALLLNSAFFVFVVASFVPVLALNPCA